MAISRIMIRPPTRASNGAQTVNRMFGNLSKLVRRTPVPRQYRQVINWGNSTPLTPGNYRLYNNPEAIAVASNKLSAAQSLSDGQVAIPEFLTHLTEERAGMWLARTVLNGSGGVGIKVIRKGDPVPDAPLYVKYIPKVLEYRLHVVGDEVIFAQQKKRKLDAEQTDDQRLIRNYDNGWVFAIEDVEVPDELIDEAVKAVKVLGLDFGAVDCVIGKKDNKPYILEVNTAPGLESPSLIAEYEQAFKRMLGVTDG